MKELSKDYIERNDLETPLKAHVYYDLGGTNYFTGANVKRGYYLSITPVNLVRNNEGEVIMEEQTAFTGTKILLNEVKRRSKKASEEALKLAREKKDELIEYVISDNPQLKVS